MIVRSLVVLLLAHAFRLAICHELVVCVNENGTDDSLCLMSNGSKPCKSLQYVLHFLTSSDSFLGAKALLVNVTSNQTITGMVQYDLASPVNATVLGSGHPFILCDSDSSLSITAGDRTQAELVWKGLIFYGCGFLTPNEASYPGLYHVNFKSLAFHDCSLMLLTGLQLSNVHHVDISDSMFTQHHHANASVCSTLVNNTCWYIYSNSTLDLEFEINTFIFSGNTIANYTCHSLIYVLITSDCLGDIVITGNLIINLYFHDKAQSITLMSFLGHKSNSSINNSAVFSDNFFRNILHSDHVIFLQFHFNVCIIKFNNFSSIVGSSARDQFIYASCISLGACSTAYLAHNQMADNKNVGLVHVSSSNSIHVTDLASSC